MIQPDLFTGEELRDFGIAAAERDRTLVIQAVDTAITKLASTYMTHEGEPRTIGFTAEHVRGYLGRYVRDLEDVSKVIGGRMRAAAGRGEIYTRGETVTAKRTDARARRMLVWYGRNP
jgi:hypothetical protein